MPDRTGGDTLGHHRAAAGWSATEVGQRLTKARERCIGFPVARDIDFTPVLGVHAGFVNDIGDPETAGRWPVHVKDVERSVVADCTALFGGAPARTWGYVSGGGTSEGVLHGLWLARERFPDGWVYFSAAAHYCVAKAARLLRMGATAVAVDDGGAIGPESLARAVHAHPWRAAVVVVTAGTTMTEAVDDLSAVHRVLTAARVPGRHVVVDAALSGPALAADGGGVAHLLADGYGEGIDRADADSVCFSTHKSFGTPHVGGVVLCRREHLAVVARPVDYLDSVDTTIGGSRSGQTVVELRHALDVIGPDGLNPRAVAARAVADHAVARLRAAGWGAWRHPHAWTVVFDPPSEALAVRWGLPVSGDGAHIVCAPGVERDLIDTFVAELTAAGGAATTPDAVAAAAPKEVAR